MPTGPSTEVFYFLPEFSVDQMKAAIRAQAKELFTDRGTTTKLADFAVLSGDPTANAPT